MGSKRELDLLSYKLSVHDLPDIAYLTLKKFQRYVRHFLASSILTKYARIQRPQCTFHPIVICTRFQGRIYQGKAASTNSVVCLQDISVNQISHKESIHTPQRESNND